MSFVAIGWQVYSVRSNPLDLGLVGLAMFIPLPLLALPAGHWADRYPRRTLLGLATLLDAAVMLGLLFVTRKMVADNPMPPAEPPRRLAPANEVASESQRHCQEKQCDLTGNAGNAAA
jgi:hypothetical protein